MSIGARRSITGEQCGMFLFINAVDARCIPYWYLLEGPFRKLFVFALFFLLYLYYFNLALREELQCWLLWQVSMLNFVRIHLICCVTAVCVDYFLKWTRPTCYLRKSDNSCTIDHGIAKIYEWIIFAHHRIRKWFYVRIAHMAYHHITKISCNASKLFVFFSIHKIPCKENYCSLEMQDDCGEKLTAAENWILTRLLPATSIKRYIELGVSNRDYEKT